jgi:hypothetical protein
LNGIQTGELFQEKKLQFYKLNKYQLNDILLTTTESDKGSIDTLSIGKVINKIAKLI